MNKLTKKNKIKDYVIISLVKTLAETYSLNYNIDKSLIEKNILDKLNSFDILDTDITDLDNINVHNKITKLIKNIIPKNSNYQNMPMINNNNYTTELIGKGGFSNVYKVFNPIDNLFYAVKKIGIDKDYKNALTEIRSLANLNHTNIVRYHMSWLESPYIENRLFVSPNLLHDKDNLNSLVEYKETDYKEFLCIQMELCKSTLKEYLNTNNLNLNQKKNIVLDIAKGIKYIHNNNILHRDLKPSNILISNQNTIKISDFGLSSTVYDSSEQLSGTLGYIAPETFNKGIFTKNSDLYSFGIIILEIFFVFKTCMEKMQLIDKIKSNNNIDNIISLEKLRLLTNNVIDKDILYIIKNLIKNIPEERIKIDKIIEILS